MNIRRKKYRANRIAGMNQYNAAIAAGYGHYTARKACVIEKGVKRSIIDELERVGLTDAKQAQELNKLTQWPHPDTKLKVWKHISELKHQVSNKLGTTVKNIIQFVQVLEANDASIGAISQERYQATQ